MASRSSICEVERRILSAPASTSESERGIIVELMLLSNSYAPEVWPLNPPREENSVQGIGKIDVRFRPSSFPREWIAELPQAIVATTFAVEGKDCEQASGAAES